MKLPITKLIATRRPAWVWLGLMLPSLLLASCLVDTDHPCGKLQVPEGDHCACQSGYGLTGNTCVACGTNEVGSLDGCVCAPGFGRTDDSLPCVATDVLGQACKVDADCNDTTFSHCQMKGDAGYCTHAGCASSADCSNDYECNTKGDPSFCERPPGGFGMDCTSSSDCAGLEASYCESVVARACVVSGCKADVSLCPGSWSCCDIALLGASLCLPPSQLDNGNCPGGGKLVSGGN